MYTITKIRIPRCKVVFGDSQTAVVHLNKISHSLGQPVMVRYKTDSGDTDTITAIGIKSGVGPDCYSIVSFGEETFVGDVLYDGLPDVSFLIHDITYLAKLSGSWCLFYIDESKTVRQMRELHDGDKFYSLSDSHRYFYRGGNLFRDDDSLSQLDDKLKILTIGKLNISLTPEASTISADRIQNPKIEINVSDISGASLLADCGIEVVSDKGDSIQGVILGSSLILPIEITETTRYTITATYRIGDEEISTSEDIVYSIVPESFYGVPGEFEKAYLWDGKSGIEIEYTLSKNICYLKTPLDFPVFAHVYDINGLDYISDYKITAEGDYRIYTKIDRVSIDKFVQRWELQ